jgi:hypothetical protein
MKSRKEKIRDLRATINRLSLALRALEKEEGIYQEPGASFPACAVSKPVLQSLAVQEVVRIRWRKRAASNAHTIAERLSMKVQTRTVIQEGEKTLHIRRLA